LIVFVPQDTEERILKAKPFAEFVRMSVDREYRRRGIATGILDHLIGLARSSGVTSLVLETNEPWIGVVRFYLENGFQITAQGDGNVHMGLDLCHGGILV